MELLFRKYFWTVNLLFLALAALLVAKTANVFVANKLQPPPDFSAAPVAIRPAYVAPARIDPEALSRVTGVKLPPPEVAIKEPVEAPKPIEDFSSDPVHTGLHVRLQGTTVSNDPRWSWAIIEDTTAHQNDTFMVDDKVQNTAVVLEILDDCTEAVQSLKKDKYKNPEKPERSKPCVIIRNGGRREYIDEKEGTGAIQPVIAPPIAVASAEAPKESLGAGIKAIGENEYEIPRAEVDKTLGNLNDVAMQARIVPAFKDGVATGFKLFSIRPDSIYSKIGIQNGDVIRRINGFEINSPDKALEAYSKLRESPRIEIEVERNGAVVRKNYNVR